MSSSKKLAPKVSICIPTFNRCTKVYGLVNNILNYVGPELEVVVLDNGSTDETKDLLNKINDDRFSFIQNEENIGGEINIVKVISLASGEFSLLCLDKDYLSYESIAVLIERIKQDSDVVFGHFSLNINTESEDIIYDKGFTAVMNMAYSSSHPTGMFFRTEQYINLPIVKSILKERKRFAFYPDLINGEMAMTGKARLINVPAFYTESEKEASIIASNTYTSNNAYFTPAKRLIEFDIYLENLLELSLTKSQLLKLITKIYRQQLIMSTFIYKKMMANDAVCAHHRIAKQNVSLFEIWKFSFVFSSRFSKKDIPITFFQKKIIVWKGFVIILAKSLLKK